MRFYCFLKKIKIKDNLFEILLKIDLKKFLF